MEKKFSRASNFSVKEENTLISLVKIYKDQIECKKTDTNTNKIKAEAWIKIGKEFNSISGDVYRSHQMLKNKYENIKKRTKQKFADNKKYISGTGGGPSKDIIITDTDSSLHEILGTQLTGFTSEFDGDAAAESIILQYDDDNCLSSNEDLVTPKDDPGTPQTHKIVPQVRAGGSLSVEQHSSLDLNTDEYSHVSNDWAKYTPAMLKKPLSHPLQSSEHKENTSIIRKKPQGLGAKLEEWAMNKSKLADTQEKTFLEKHLLTVQQMKEKHEQQMAIQKEESQLRIKFLTEEHEMKMKLLEIEINQKK